ncbi:MAG: immunoglobulin-like domain-containing protein [Bacteroidota bacterium]
MKKNISLAGILCLLFFFSCVKENDVSMDFKITGVNNKTITRGNGIEMPLKVFYLGGEKQDVTVSVENLPSGISITFDNSTGEPDFSLLASVAVDINTPAGTYVIPFKVKSEADKFITKDFNLTVADPANHFPQIVIAGSTSMVWTLNDPFIDPGYYATDVEDGDLSSLVQVTGSVDYNLTGFYTIIYKVKDSDGDSTIVQRTIQIVNNNAYMQGLYNCTTVIQGGPTFTWLGYVETSSTINKRFVFNKISDCLGTLAIPMRLQVIPGSGNSVTIPSQIVFGTNPAQPAHCDEAYHNIAGGGTVTYTMPYTFIVTYTDLYEDLNGLQHTYTKTDTYIKVP